MLRREFLFCLAASAVVAAPARAQDYADDLMRELVGDGFGEIAVSRTLLGRLRILASRGGGQREIILNPNTGEILRDLWLVRARPDEDRQSGGQKAGDGGSSSGSGGSDDSGSDDDGSDDDGSDDDNSGSGSSGDGGSDDNSGSDDSGDDDDSSDDDDDSDGKGSGKND